MKKIFSLLPFVLLCLNVHSQQANYNLLIGTYTKPGKSEGIYTYNFNTYNGATKLKSVTKNVQDPSFLAISPDRKSVYAVNENGDKSSVSAFRFSPYSGKLTPLNKKESYGADPCYVIADNQHVIIANYSGGSIAVYGRNADGSLTDAKQIIQHTGRGIDPKKRQESAHVHMVKFTPDKKYLISNDLGEDHTYIYNYNPNAKKQVLTIKNVVKVPQGTGPRHLTFTPDGKYAYLVHEFNGNITAFSYADGKLNQIQEVSSVPEGFSGAVDGADIHVSPDGKFLYESNRGDANSINVFAISAIGKLTFSSRVSTLGKGPRNFAIDPSGKFLLVGNQRSDEVIIFRRNKNTGALTDTGKRIQVGAPVSLVFTRVN